jgi:hypothetical protein
VCLDRARHVDVGKNDAAKDCPLGIGITRQQRYANRWISVGVHLVIVDGDLNRGKPVGLPIADLRLPLGH